MLRYLFLAMLAVIIATSNNVQAQSKKGPNGGTIVSSQGHPIEFVLKGGQELVFYLGDDDGSPLPTKGVRGRATIQEGGKTVTVSLTAAPPNMLVGKAPAPIGSKARVAFSASLHGHSLTARYVTE